MHQHQQQQQRKQLQQQQQQQHYHQEKNEKEIFLSKKDKISLKLFRCIYYYSLQPFGVLNNDQFS